MMDIAQVRTALNTLAAHINGTEVNGTEVNGTEVNGTEVFGAGSHRFQLNDPVTRPELDGFEVSLGVGLPAEYRAFLLDAGNGGAGPGYGLWPMGQWDPTNRLLEPIEPPGWPDAPSKPFPYSDSWTIYEGAVGPAPGADADHAEHDRYNAKLDELAWAAGIADGALPIADLGCAIRLILVVTGAERGHIWIDDRANAGEIYPACVAGRDRLTFGQLYEDWIIQSIASCETGSRSPRSW